MFEADTKLIPKSYWKELKKKKIEIVRSKIFLRFVDDVFCTYPVDLRLFIFFSEYLKTMSHTRRRLTYFLGRKVARGVKNKYNRTSVRINIICI